MATEREILLAADRAPRALMDALDTAQRGGDAEQPIRLALARLAEIKRLAKEQQ